MWVNSVCRSGRDVDIDRYECRVKRISLVAEGVERPFFERGTADLHSFNFGLNMGGGGSFHNRQFGARDYTGAAKLVRRTGHQLVSLSVALVLDEMKLHGLSRTPCHCHSSARESLG